MRGLGPSQPATQSLSTSGQETIRQRVTVLVRLVASTVPFGLPNSAFVTDNQQPRRHRAGLRFLPSHSLPNSSQPCCCTAWLMAQMTPVQCPPSWQQALAPGAACPQPAVQPQLLGLQAVHQAQQLWQHTTGSTCGGTGWTTRAAVPCGGRRAACSSLHNSASSC